MSMPGLTPRPAPWVFDPNRDPPVYTRLVSALFYIAIGLIAVYLRQTYDWF